MKLFTFKNDKNTSGGYYADVWADKINLELFLKAEKEKIIQARPAEGERRDSLFE